MDNLTNSINTLKIIPGNSIGRSCRTISAETIQATIRIMICFRLIGYLLADTTVGCIAPRHTHHLKLDYALFLTIVLYSNAIKDFSLVNRQYGNDVA
jgi:hypothetical protein